jgi:hypothetical protein
LQLPDFAFDFRTVRINMALQHLGRAKGRAIQLANYKDVDLLIVTAIIHKYFNNWDK